ncbi:MAG: (Fe-S)-binding protein, partial [Rikenellaceae bacterium]|nr:(Fe-S)-binding protein [Rikenellaceae bacterium]
MDIYFHPFVIPFSLGVLIMLGVLIYKYANWFADLTSQERGIFFKSIFTRKTLISIKECVTECLLHLKIYRVNLRLGYMHMSLALGWFLLILVGWLETAAILSDQIVPLYIHVFFRFFVPVAPDNVAHVI